MAWQQGERVPQKKEGVRASKSEASRHVHEAGRPRARTASVATGLSRPEPAIEVKKRVSEHPNFYRTMLEPKRSVGRRCGSTPEMRTGITLP